MLGQIVDHQQYVAPARHEILGHGAGGIGRQPLEAGRRIGLADDEQAALRRTVAAHRLDHPRDRGRLLADRGVDADHIARRAG